MIEYIERTKCLDDFTDIWYAYSDRGYKYIMKLTGNAVLRYNTSCYFDVFLNGKKLESSIGDWQITDKLEELEKTITEEQIKELTKSKEDKPKEYQSENKNKEWKNVFGIFKNWRSNKLDHERASDCSDHNFSSCDLEDNRHYHLDKSFREY